MNIGSPSKFTSLYSSDLWSAFSKQVQERDGYQCVKCGIQSEGAELRVYHQHVTDGIRPWEHDLDDCSTRCEACSGVDTTLDPQTDWTLVSITDLGGLDNHCERPGCNRAIRYEHLVYHPGPGYRIVGSTCIWNLTASDISISEEVLKCYKQVNKFLQTAVWKERFDVYTGKYGLAADYSAYSRIFIHGTTDRYSYRVYKTKHFSPHKDLIELPGMLRFEVEMLAAVALLGFRSTNFTKTNILRGLYRHLKRRERP